MICRIEDEDDASGEVNADLDRAIVGDSLRNRMPLNDSDHSVIANRLAGKIDRLAPGQLKERRIGHLYSEFSCFVAEEKGENRRGVV